MQHTYLQIAQALQTEIETECYLVGEKLPSVRQYARTMGVSVSSVTRCYRHLDGSIDIQREFDYQDYKASLS